MVCAWVALTAFAAYSLTVPFIYRHMVICGEGAVSLGKYALLLTLPLAQTAAHLLIAYLVVYPTREESEAAEEYFFGDVPRGQRWVIGFLGAVCCGAPSH